jgi:hypothetical protein
LETVRLDEVTIHPLERRLEFVVPTEAGKTYVPEYCDSLGAFERHSLPPASGDGATHAIHDPDGLGTQRLYRVRVNPNPIP